MLEERTQPTRAYISYTTYFFVLFYISIITPFGFLIYILPDFLFSRPTFATSFRDSPSQPHFATHIRDPLRDSHSRTHFATHIRDPLSRLTLATTLAIPLHDSRSRPHLRLSFTTPDRAPNRDSLFFVATSVVRPHH